MGKNEIYRIFLSSLMILLFLSVNAQPERRVLSREGERLFISYDNGKSYSLVNERVVTVKLRANKTIDSSLKILRTNRLGYIDLSVPEKIDVTEFVETLEKNAFFEIVKYAVFGEVCLSPNDICFISQWYLSNINLPSAWNFTTGNPNIKIAVLDQEIDWNHPDIGMGNDDYKNINSTLGYNYKEGTNQSVNPLDHGTLVAGIIGAKANNTIGIAGVTGGFGTQGVTIIPYGVGSYLGDRYVDMSVVDDAILDAVDKGVKIINMSFGSNSSYYPDIDAAIEYAHNHGVTLVAATGNDNFSWLLYPASNQYTIAVGATDQNNQRASFSNYGVGLDFVAPGVNIYGTKINNDYGSDSGTSFAVPQVSGVAALMLSVNPTLTPDNIRSVLRSTCTKLSGYSYTSGWNNEVGYGLLNAYAAVSAVDIGYNIVGKAVLCDTATYSVTDIPAGYSITWSVDNNNFSVTSNGNQCLVTYTGIPQYEIANLTASLTWNGYTVKSVSKRIVMHGTDMYLEGIQSGIYDENGNMPAVGATFTIPANQGDRSMAYRQILMNRDSIPLDTIPVIIDDPYLPYVPDNPMYGITEIYGGADIYLVGDRLDGMSISFSGEEPEYLSSDGGTVISFRMPEVSRITSKLGYYYVVLHATSEGGCHDFDLYFKVIPVAGEAIGDHEISLFFTDSSVRVDFDAMEWEDLPNGMLQPIPWYLRIIRMSNSAQMHYSVNTTDSKTVDTSSWPADIYIVHVNSSGNNYTKKFLKQ